RKKKWKLKALSATSIAGGFLVFLYEKNWLEAIIEKALVFKAYFRYKNFFLGICLFNTTSKGPADNTVSTKRLSVIFLSRRT
ncbi:hypothetical protein F6P76_01035, partial [Streptococcus suis]|nr:hypothetical protein [Streptococcus suis]